MKSTQLMSSASLSSLSADIQHLSARLVDAFAQSDAELFLVGGIVRDLLLGATVGRDLDFATSATPQQTERALRKAGGNVFKIGEKFGTIGGVFGSLQVEVTTYRAEAYQPGSRKPEVAFGRHLADDLARRDFTINAIALDPETGAVHDPFGGQEDLTNGLIRAVGNPIERFAEDPLRLLRGVRFASRLGFELDASTAQAISQKAPALE